MDPQHWLIPLKDLDPTTPYAIRHLAIRRIKWIKTLWLAMSRCISSRSGKPAPRQLSSRCRGPLPESSDVIPRLGDVIPMSGDVIPRSGDVITSGSSSTRGQPAQANRWRQCCGMLDNPATCGICTTKWGTIHRFAKRKVQNMLKMMLTMQN